MNLIHYTGGSEAVKCALASMRHAATRGVILTVRGDPGKTGRDSSQLLLKQYVLPRQRRGKARSGFLRGVETRYSLLGPHGFCARQLVPQFGKREHWG
jgi:hypothetical protein